MYSLLQSLSFQTSPGESYSSHTYMCIHAHTDIHTTHVCQRMCMHTIIYFPVLHFFLGKCIGEKKWEIGIAPETQEDPEWVVLSCIHNADYCQSSTETARPACWSFTGFPSSYDECTGKGTNKIAHVIWLWGPGRSELLELRHRLQEVEGTFEAKVDLENKEQRHCRTMLEQRHCRKFC